MAGLSGTGFVTGTTAQGGNLGFTTWLKTFFLPSHEKMVFIPRIKEGGKPYQYGKFRTLGALSSTQVTNTNQTSVDLLTWQTPVTSVGTLTPYGYYIAIAYDDVMRDSVELDMNAPLRTMLEDCAAEACDVTALQAVASLTQVVGDAATHPDLALVRSTIAKLRIATNGKVDVRDGALQGVFDPCVEPDLLSIPEMTQANYRGDGENPLVKGFFTKGSGINWNYTNSVYASGGANNCIFDPEAFLIMWNTHPTAEKQRDGLSNLLLSYANFGVAVARNERAFALRTVTALA
jgi:hypothetical protein